MLLLCSICLQNGDGMWRIEPHKWEGMYEVLYVWIGVYACIYTLVCMMEQIWLDFASKMEIVKKDYRFSHILMYERVGYKYIYIGIN